MKDKFKACSETEKSLSALPQSVQPFPDKDFAQAALSRRQYASNRKNSYSLRGRRRLCAALSVAICLLVAAAAMVSVQLIKRSDRYNGIDGYESQLLTDFGFGDYNRQNGTDFPALPASDDGTTCFRITTFKKSKKAVFLTQTSTIKGATVELSAELEKCEHSEIYDAFFSDDCGTTEINGVTAELASANKSLSLTAARFAVDENRFFLIVRKGDSLDLLLALLEEII